MKQKLDSVNFERLLSYRPKLDGLLAFEQPTLRDMVFEFFCRKYTNDEQRALQATVDYIDAVWMTFGAPSVVGENGQ